MNLLCRKFWCDSLSRVRLILNTVLKKTDLKHFFVLGPSYGILKSDLPTQNGNYKNYDNFTSIAQTISKKGYI